MKIIDAHQHFWMYDPVKYSWIDEYMTAIRNDYMPSDLLPILQKNNVEGCIAVQALQTEEETDFLTGLAAENPFIKGVVGWVDLRAENIGERLEHYSKNPIIKGFRHVLQSLDPSFMLQPDFLNGISLLAKYGFTYDILIYPRHLDAAAELVAKFPNQPFVIDHIAKPYIKDGLIGEWSKGMQAIAKFPNVYCKLSGMVTEAKPYEWMDYDFKPYLERLLQFFGIERLMFGSDWPVCLLAAHDYAELFYILNKFFIHHSERDIELVYSGNAIKFYKL